MKLLLSCVLVAWSAAPLAALPKYFGAPAPLTNTRYASFGGGGVLVTNGRDAFLLWGLPGRITRLEKGENRVGRPILNSVPVAAAWTGTHFIAAGTRSSQNTDSIEGRLLDANGDPIGDIFTILGAARKPRLASNGQRTLLIHDDTKVRILGANGVATPAEQTIPVDITKSGAASQVTSNGSTFAAITTGEDQVAFTVFDALGSIQSTHIFSANNGPGAGGAIASNGSGYQAVWRTLGGGMGTATISGDGTQVVRTTLEGVAYSEIGWPAIAWVNGRYHVAFSADGALRHVAIGPGEQPQDPAPSASYGPPAITTVAGSATLVWNRAQYGPMLARNLLDPTDRGTEVAWGALVQNHILTASAVNTTLVAWNESNGITNSVWIGIRDRNGAWIERRIANEQQGMSAASDGRDFVVITIDEGESFRWSATFVNELGQVTARTQKYEPFWAGAIAWTGTHYAVARLDAQLNLYAQLLDQKGLVSVPVLLAAASEQSGFVHSAGIASADGANLFAVWHTNRLAPCFPCGSHDGRDTKVWGRRLTAELQPIGPALLIADDPAEYASVAWDGRDYVAMWSPWNSTLGARRISPTGVLRSPFEIPRLRPGRRAEQQPVAVRLTGGMGVTWGAGGTGELILLDEAGLAARHLLGQGHSNALVRLPDGRTGFLEIVPMTAAPHHGAPRVLMAVGDSIPLESMPDAPALEGHLERGRIALTWTAPGQPVNGYRIEYRAGRTAAWNELDRFYAADATSATIAPWRSGQIEFRIRAWNDGGAGPYSQTVALRLVKQRSVRR